MTAPLRRRLPRSVWLWLLLLFVIVSRVAWDRWGPNGDRANQGVPSEGVCELLEVTNNLSLIIRQPNVLKNENGESTAGPITQTFKIKLLAIRLPDSRPALSRSEADQQAQEFLRKELAAGSIRLQLDKRRISRDGIFLAYVIVGEKLLNEELVRHGLAIVDVQPGDSATVTRRLRRAESESQRLSRGVWKTPREIQ